MTISTFATHESQLQNLCLTNPARALELCQQLAANADEHSKALLRIYQTISQKMLEQNPLANPEPINSELANPERQQLEQIKLENARLHHELQAKTEQLETLAMHDQQTGLFNRRYIETHLDREYARARRLEKTLCVALISIDHFKTISETGSSDTGSSDTGSSNTAEEVLRTIATLFKNHARASEQLARFNTDEFILVIPDATLEQTQIASERLRAAIEAFDWTDIHPELKVTLSIGLSDDAFTSHPDEMLKQADARLQQAKRAGCNRVCSILDLQR